jgi:phosphoesterase RecJ-like protein
VGALLLQKQVLSTLEILCEGKVAVQVLRKKDLEASGANFEDAESFINIPLKSLDVVVSILVKENLEGKIRCSLRSKGQINVSKIAQSFGGGGHITAAGFKSSNSIEDTLKKVIETVEKSLELT